MITPTLPSPWVSDLGLSGDHAAADVASSLGASSTQVAGTPAYQAPELLLGKPATAATDVYALGCVLFEAITGEPVFGWPGGVADYSMRHLLQKPPRLEGVPGELADLIYACLAKKPEGRPAFADVELALLDLSGLTAATAIPSVPVDRIINTAKGLANIGFEADAVKLIDSLPNPPFAALYVKVQALRQRRELDHAERVLRTLQPTDEMQRSDIEMELGNIVGIRGDNHAAIEHYKAVAEVNPTSSAVWANLAMLHNKLGDRRAAIQYMQKASEIAVDLRYLIPLIHWFVEDGSCDAALSYADDLVRSHPDVGIAHGLRAYALFMAIGQGHGLLDHLRSELATEIRMAADSGDAKALRLIQLMPPPESFEQAQ